MEIFGLAIPLALLLLCGVILFSLFAWALFWFLIHVGVIVDYARKPPHVDSGDYRIEQGREVDDR
jgi:hypothetical protein